MIFSYKSNPNGNVVEDLVLSKIVKVMVRKEAGNIKDVVVDLDTSNPALGRMLFKYEDAVCFLEAWEEYKIKANSVSSSNSAIEYLSQLIDTLYKKDEAVVEEVSDRDVSDEEVSKEEEVLPNIQQAYGLREEASVTEQTEKTEPQTVNEEEDATMKDVKTVKSKKKTLNDLI